MADLYLFNKPFNVLSQFTDNSGRSTLADFIQIKNIYQEYLYSQSSTELAEDKLVDFIDQPIEYEELEIN